MGVDLSLKDEVKETATYTTSIMTEVCIIDTERHLCNMHI